LKNRSVFFAESRLDTVPIQNRSNGAMYVQEYGRDLLMLLESGDNPNGDSPSPSERQASQCPQQLMDGRALDERCHRTSGQSVSDAKS
jgi:hypothetical protein